MQLAEPQLPIAGWVRRNDIFRQCVWPGLALVHFGWLNGDAA